MAGCVHACLYIHLGEGPCRILSQVNQIDCTDYFLLVLEAAQLRSRPIQIGTMVSATSTQELAYFSKAPESSTLTDPTAVSKLVDKQFVNCELSSLACQFAVAPSRRQGKAAAPLPEKGRMSKVRKTLSLMF